MKNNIAVLRSVLGLCIITVLLTIKFPIIHSDIGTLLIPGYKWAYGVIAFVILFGLFVVLSKRKTDDLLLKRMEFILSILFMISLLSNIVFF